MAIEQLRTVADYHAYVDSLPPDAPKAELINGRIVVAARPVIRHARYLRDILEAVNVYIRTHYILYTETNSPLGRLAAERLYGAPEWACEILSPGTQASDEQDKYLAYLKAGVREYWLVDPDAPTGVRFRLFERVAEGPTSGMPAFQRIEGGPEQSRLFPGIKIDGGLL